MDPFEDCLAKGRLKKIEPDAERVARELDTAREEHTNEKTALVQLQAQLGAATRDGLTDDEREKHRRDLSSVIGRHLGRPFDTPPPTRASEPAPPGSPIGMPPPHLVGCGQGDGH